MFGDINIINEYQNLSWNSIHITIITEEFSIDEFYIPQMQTCYNVFLLGIETPWKSNHTAGKHTSLYGSWFCKGSLRNTIFSAAVA
jgi:hypothetical protein